MVLHIWEYEWQNVFVYMSLYRLLNTALLAARGTDVTLSSQISLTTLKIKNFDISGMHAEAASLVVHQIGLNQTISMSTPCLVGANQSGLVNDQPVAICMNMHTKTEDMQLWRRFLDTFTLLQCLCHFAGPCHLPVLISETRPDTVSKQLPKATRHHHVGAVASNSTQCGETWIMESRTF